MPVYYLVSSVVVVGVEDRPPLGDLGCALRHRPALVLRSHPGVAPWLPHEGLANGEGSVVTSLCHPARSCARCAHSVNTVGRSKWESTEQIVTWLFYLVIEIIGYLNIWPDADGNSQSHFQSDQR